MGRYYWNKRDTVEDCKSISIFNLKKWGVLKNNYNSGIITWTSGFDGKKTKVGYSLNLVDNPCFELDYKIRSGDDEEWTSIKHEYPLVSTPCNYGGKRWWFECSVYNKGFYCGKRVAKLYLGSGSNYFACRHCYNLSYASRNINRRGRFGILAGSFDLSQETEKLAETIKIPFRNGQPTKKYRKLLEKRNKLEYLMGFIDANL